MKKVTSIFMILLVASTLFSSFRGNDPGPVSPPSEFELLVQYLEANGDFINSNLAPAIILAPEIKDNLKNKGYLVLDIRSEAWFDYGHIKNAQNVKGPELLNYFKTSIEPENYEKITIVCYSGQSAAYFTSLLRLYGFDNVYSLKWGMSSWAEEFATNVWLKNSTNEFSDQQETTPNTMPSKGEVPTITSGNTNPSEILKMRVAEAFAKPYKDFIIKSADVFASPDDYFIMNYVTEEKYNFGHIKGAVHYEPGTSLSSKTNLFTIPTNKKVLMSCNTGQTAAYNVAFLQVLGYDVGNLAYGSNSYMNSKMVEKNWNGFSKAEIHNYPVVE